MTKQDKMAQYKMEMLHQQMNNDREKSLMEYQLKRDLVKHYIETIEVAIRHLKELGF